MRIHARDLAVGDILQIKDRRLHIVRVERDNAVAVLAAGFDFLIHFAPEALVTVRARARGDPTDAHGPTGPLGSRLSASPVASAGITRLHLRRKEPDMGPVKAAIIYYSATGAVYALARAAAEGAEKAGADVRLRKVAELAPPEAINATPAWGQHIQDTADVTEASLDDPAWADVVLFGTPTRFGNPASQLRAFIDATGPLWAQGALAGKVYSAFTASNTAHGGQESTILALGNTFYHWGGIIVPPGYTDPIQFKSGNPYGASHVDAAGPPDDVALEAARYQARRAVDAAAALKAGRAA